jgi:hypothetical protein
MGVDVVVDVEVLSFYYIILGRVDTSVVLKPIQ